VDFAAAFVVAFVAIFPVELPDKTFVATLVLATRYPPLPTWLGVTLAFAVQCVVAVFAGSLIGRLPTLPVKLAAAALFLVGAVILARGARRADIAEREHEEEIEAKVKEAKTGWRAFTASFLVLFAAEWGDLSQLLTAGLVASGRDPWGTGLGSFLGLTVVSGLAVLLGRWLLQRVRLAVIRYFGAAICAILGIVTAVSAF
jgi:putative Ca2+/H+ antiporter (TMEM165/GDT1 family)